jgi:hypothetical protein
LVAEQDAFTRDVVALLQFAHEHGYVITLGEAWRTPEQQAVYVKTGRSLTTKSQHLRRLAIDLNIFQDGRLLATKDEIMPLGQYWEALHPGKNRWGGNFNRLVDCPHFERMA